jgi:hypothetical protein
MAVVKEDRKALDTLLNNLKKLEKSSVDAGVISSERHPNFDGTVASLAALYEFGFERENGDRVRASFIQDVDYSQSIDFATPFNRNFRNLTKSHTAVDNILSDIGEEMSKNYEGFIRSNSVEYTVEGSYIPKSYGTRLIDTETLVDSITYEVNIGG